MANIKANSNEEAAVKAETTSVPKKYTHLLELAPPAYSITGYMPTSATFRITPDAIKAIVLRIAKGFISDIQSVTVEVNHKNGAVTAFVWLPSDSRHLKDKSTMDESSVIRKPIVRYSQELKEFMDKFCYDDNKRTVNEESNLPISGICVALERFMYMEFDRSGEQFAREYGSRKLKSNIALTAQYTDGDGSAFGKLKYIEVKKTLASDLDRTEPRPKRSFNA